eukprot:gene5128-1148_t
MGTTQGGPVDCLRRHGDDAGGHVVHELLGSREHEADPR